MVLASSPSTPGSGLESVIPIAVAAAVGLYYAYKRKNSRSPSGPVISPIHPLIAPPPGIIVPPPGTRLSAIDQVRQLLGPPPRTFTPEISQYFQTTRPTWARGSDELAGQYEHQTRICVRGRVVWATFIQANSVMFKPGRLNAPASMMYSEDPYYDEHPEELVRVSRALGQLKNTEPTDPEMATFARMLTNERIRAMRLASPNRLTGGRVVFHTSMVFERRHLPHGYLTSNLMPVFVDPEPTGLLMMVPAAYWPPSLLQMWDPNPAPQAPRAPRGRAYEG